jgi:phage gp46-like protein
MEQAPHFGSPAQPYADGALAWLKDNIEGQELNASSSDATGTSV